MEKNKTGKYFKYAIGEIVLVVLGILIAVSINNWNQDRLEYSTEIEYLKSVKSDLLLDKQEMESIFKIQQARLHYANMLYEYLDISESNNDSINKYFDLLLIGRNPTFFPVMGTYKTSHSTEGKRSESMKNANIEIAKLYDGSYVKLTYNGELLDSRNKALRDRMVRQIRKRNMLTLNENKPVYLDELYKFIWRQKYYVTLLQKNIVSIDDVVKQIERALKP